MNATHSFDLLKAPLIGPLLGHRRARLLLQIPLLVLSLLMLADGFFGPPLSPKNLATTLVWIHFRGLLVLTLLAAGNFFCYGCPFLLFRDLARKAQSRLRWQPRWNWPRPLRNKWLSIALFAGVLFVYEAFSLWASPWWTAWLIAGYFLAILLVDLNFKHAAFCKFVCPIGQFNFISATLSPLEVSIREPAVCDRCSTRDCIRGRRATDTSTADPFVILQRGCELALFQPQKIGNLDCTFCLDCVHACPHDNVGILSRVPGDELLLNETRRSGIGSLANRLDIGALGVLFLFAALLNVFGMVSPIYAVERWLGAYLPFFNQTARLAAIFLLALVVAPGLLLTLAAFLAKSWGRLSGSCLAIAQRYCYALVPLGFGIWLAHYGFHFLTGLFTFIPLSQRFVLDVFGSPLLGSPAWLLVGLPLRVVQPLEYGLLTLGFLGSLFFLQQHAEADRSEHWLPIFLPWAVLSAALFGLACWFISLPMDMRATFLE